MITEQLNASLEYIAGVDATLSSNVATAALEKLSKIGLECDIESGDLFLLTLSMQSMRQRICNECNVTEVPDGLFYVYVDMTIGDYLNTLYCMGKLDIDGLDLQGLVSSIDLGDASVSYSNSTNDMSADAKFRLLVESLRKGRDFACYRRLKW